MERMLKNAQVIDDSSKDGEVGINNRVTVEFTDDPSKASYKIVTSVRSNSLKGLISIESPLGKALMGHRVGDVVGVTVDENNSYEVKIKEIEDTTDDAEDEIRKY